MAIHHGLKEFNDRSICEVPPATSSILSDPLHILLPQVWNDESCGPPTVAIHFIGRLHIQLTLRSPIIVSAVLAKIDSLELHAAVERVTATGPCDFSPALWNDVQELLNQRKPSSTSRLNLIVIRSVEPSRTMTFYKMLGMKFQEEKHGRGPVHWAADLDGVTPEIYPAKSAEEVDATTGLGFVVKDAASVLNTLRLSEILMDEPWNWFKRDSRKPP